MPYTTKDGTLVSHADIGDILMCDECAMERERTPGLFRQEGTCAICSGLGSVAKTTTCMPKDSRRVIHNETEAERRNSPASAVSRSEGTALCPYCGAEITRLHYSFSVCEYGSCDLDGDSMDSDDRNSEGETTYSCPECEVELAPRDVVYEDGEEEEATKG